MFNSRFVYFAGSAAPSEAPAEETPADKAQQKMKEFMPPEPEQLDSGKMETQQGTDPMEVEAKKTNDVARADIMGILKDSKPLNPNVPPAGVDAATFRDIVADLRSKLPQGKDNHFATHCESLTSGPDDPDGYYFMSVNDATKNPPIRFFYKKGTDFTPRDKTFLRDVDDATYLKLTGQPRA